MSASADHVKALVRAHATGDDKSFYSVALQVAARAARQGHNRLATELRDLIDDANARSSTPSGPTPVVRPKGELADLVTATYPDVRLTDMTLDDEVRGPLERVLHEQRQRERLEGHGFAPIHRLLFVGPPGTGKTMSAAALATELSLPLFTIRLDTLISRFMGETAAKLRVVFEAAAQTRAVFLFDEFDALGAERGRGDDVGEARRIVNSFLLFLDDAPPESLVIAATNHPGILDQALFRRFDLAVRYEFPDVEHAVEVMRRRLSVLGTSAVDWAAIAEHVGHLSHADLVRAAESAAKQVILAGEKRVTTERLAGALRERRGIKA